MSLRRKERKETKRQYPSGIPLGYDFSETSLPFLLCSPAFQSVIFNPARYICRFRWLFLFICFGLISVESFSADSSIALPVVEQTTKQKRTYRGWSLDLPVVEQTTKQKRPIQDIALQAFARALQEGADSFLHISPTGTGKTYVLAEVLKSRIEAWERENRSPPQHNNNVVTKGSRPEREGKTISKDYTSNTRTAGKISIVTVHQTHLVDQLFSEIDQSLKGISVNIINWNKVKRRSSPSRQEIFFDYLQKALHPVGLENSELKAGLTEGTGPEATKNSYSLGINRTGLENSELKAGLTEGTGPEATKNSYPLGINRTGLENSELKDGLTEGTGPEATKNSYPLGINSSYPTVFVMTTQSLKIVLDHLFQKHVSPSLVSPSSGVASPAISSSQASLPSSSSSSSLYERLAQNLDGIYVDEAHHLGASETHRVLSSLWKASKAFLYGATATPFHYGTNIMEMFKTSHWSYLNHAGVSIPPSSGYTQSNLFAQHSIEGILDQLSLAIRSKDITPFEDLYVIGESSFKGTKDQPVFIQGRNNYFVLNPVHYKRLAEILYPVLSVNQKGFVVTATIAEAERLQEFLSKIFKEIQFEVYHSQMETEARDQVFRNSRESRGSHYIVAVRALDEGVNLPHLSAYIDLNFTVSIKQMVQRIGRVLRLYPGKEMADILFLIDYKNAEMVRDILKVLEKVEQLAFKEKGVRGNSKRSGDSDFRFADSDITPLRRDELSMLRTALEISIRKFWSGEELRWLTWEELRDAIVEYNKKAPDGEKINSATYQMFYKKIPRAPSHPEQSYYDFKERGGWPALLGKFKLTWEELRDAIVEYNKKAPEGKKIINSVTYQSFYKKIPDAPSDPGRFYPDFKERGGWSVLLGKFNLTWEELRDAIVEYNKKAPDGETINSATYRRFYKKIPRAHSNPERFYPDFKERGGWPALLGKFKLTWEELRDAIVEYNKKAPEGKKIINSVTYQSFYKKIPGAHSDPGRFYPDFKERGGWPALLSKPCPKAFTAQ